MDIRVEQVPAERTYPLRQRVLRPYLTLAEMKPLPGEQGPGSVHLAALTPDDEVVGTGMLLREPFSRMPERTDAWRLRGMAVDADRRGHGIGAAVLGRMIEHVAGHGGGLIWCNARLLARSFYQRAGFSAVGAEWDEPLIGPHVTMWRPVDPERDQSR